MIITDNYSKHTLHFIECGCCGHYHKPDFWGDCRDDANRFSMTQIEAMPEDVLVEDLEES